MSRPYVIAIASEKGGVGKTTIATNLAVYLKALREDLPVTIASFDNHFSIDQMFALGPRPQTGIAALFEKVPAAELVVMGQYGVQYMASSRRLVPPRQDPDWLGLALGSADLDGLLILDTRPVLDWFTEAALLAADLVLVPVKDRAALINAAALRQVLAGVGRVERLWLLPSLVDTRARLNAEVLVHEFLSHAARERDYQVLDILISKSPKVESLASGFSSRIRPVLTHARNTAVHAQLRQLAGFVLTCFDAGAAPAGSACVPAMQEMITGGSGFRRSRRLLECPLCSHRSWGWAGHYFFDLRSRRRGFMHPDCFAMVNQELMMEEPDGQVDLLALVLEGAGLVGPECRLTAHLWSAEPGLLGSEELELASRPRLSDCLAVMTGRPLDAAYRELILIDPRADVAELQSTSGGARDFPRRRRRLARELRRAGLI